jgi:hypothetical protein
LTLGKSYALAEFQVVFVVRHDHVSCSLITGITRERARRDNMVPVIS